MTEKAPKRPLTIPIQVETIDGVEWLSFVYTAKGVSTNYKVRIDIDSINIEDLDEDFKNINSVYPKANVDRSYYKGNRWDYETSVNEIGWKLCHLNQDLLTAKRGLLQRAVDSFRNRFPSSKSRRVARVEKSIAEGSPHRKPRKKKKISAGTEADLEYITNRQPSISEPIPGGEKLTEADFQNPAELMVGLDQEALFQTPNLMGISSNDELFLLPTPSLRNYRTNRPNQSHLDMLRSKSESSFLYQRNMEPNLNPPLPKTTTRLIVETVRNYAPFQLRLRMDIDSIPEDINREFITNNQPFAKPKSHKDFLSNSIAWKLAYLNKEYLDGNIELLQRSVDVYMEKYEDPIYAPRAGKRLIESYFGR